MKKYIVILAILMTIGAVLFFLSMQKSQRFDEPMTASINNITRLDMALNVLLFKTRYGLETNHDQLADFSTKLSDEFDLLKDKLLLDEAKYNGTLREVVVDYEKQHLVKQEHIGQFQNYHSSFVKSYNELPLVTDEVFNIVGGTEEVIPLVNAINLAVYEFLRSESVESKHDIQVKTRQLEALKKQLPDQAKTALNRYLSSLARVVVANDKAQHYFTRAVERLIVIALNRVEVVGTDFRASPLGSSINLRNALIAYGLVLMSMLFFFAYVLCKHYVNLEQQVVAYGEQPPHVFTTFRGIQSGKEEADIAHHISPTLSHVRNNLQALQLNLAGVNDVLQDVAEIYNAAVAENRDDGYLSTLVSGMLKRFFKQQPLRTMQESQRLLSDSNDKLAEISKAVTGVSTTLHSGCQVTELANVNDGITKALNMADNIIQEHRIDVQTTLAELPDIVCAPSKLNQLFLNIITNAAKTMREQAGGTLTIHTEQQNDHVVICCNGQGVDVGMSTISKIVQSHGGRIHIEPEQDESCTIKIHLPIS